MGGGDATIPREGEKLGDIALETGDAIRFCELETLTLRSIGLLRLNGCELASTNGEVPPTSISFLPICIAGVEEVKRAT